MPQDSIYPEFLRTGIARLQKQGAQGDDFLGLFSALEHFRRDLTDRRDVLSILKATELYVFGLGLFESVAFLTINPASFDFELAHCAPEAEAEFLNRLVQQEIKAGRFAWALRQNTPAFFNHGAESGTLRGVFHTLGVTGQRMGMFCGILKRERVPSQEITFSLLSMLLGTCSDALADVRTTAELQNQVLATNDRLQRALKENEVLARLPAESPNPTLRLGRSGKVLYSNQAGQAVLQTLGLHVGDFVSGPWQEMLVGAFEQPDRREFEVTAQNRVYAFLVVPVPEAGYANFYGTDITARQAAEAEREKLIAELQEALARVKTLSGLVPICAWCKKVRDDRGFWNEVEVYVQNRSDATFSHGVCPQCQRQWLEGMANRQANREGPTPG